MKRSEWKGRRSARLGMDQQGNGKVEMIVVLALFVAVGAAGVHQFGRAARESLECQAEFVASAVGGTLRCVPRGAPTAVDGPPAPGMPGRRAGNGPTCSGPGCLCFLSGTPVMTADGLRPIEALAAGDLVLARDEHRGAVTFKPVLRTFANRSRALVRVTIEDGQGRRETLVATREHPFYREGHGWTPAAALAAGRDRLLDPGGRPLPVRAVELLSTADGLPVFNLEIADYHTYFVGQTGALTHNVCTPPGTTPMDEDPPVNPVDSDPLVIATSSAFAALSTSTAPPPSRREPVDAVDPIYDDVRAAYWKIVDLRRLDHTKPIVPFRVDTPFGPVGVKQAKLGPGQPYVFTDYYMYPGSGQEPASYKKMIETLAPPGANEQVIAEQLLTGDRKDLTPDQRRAAATMVAVAGIAEEWRKTGAWTLFKQNLEKIKAGQSTFDRAFGTSAEFVFAQQGGTTAGQKYIADNQDQFPESDQDEQLAKSGFPRPGVPGRAQTKKVKPANPKMQTTGTHSSDSSQPFDKELYTPEYIRDVFSNAPTMGNALEDLKFSTKSHLRDFLTARPDFPTMEELEGLLPEVRRYKKKKLELLPYNPAPGEKRDKKKYTPEYIQQAFSNAPTMANALEELEFKKKSNLADFLRARPDFPTMEELENLLPADGRRYKRKKFE